MANALGYECVIVMPQNASEEKVSQLEMLGAELLLVPAVPSPTPITTSTPPSAWPAGQRKDETNGAIWARQFDNPANRQILQRHHRPGNLAADRRPGRRIYLCGGYRGHPRRRRRCPA